MKVSQSCLTLCDPTDYTVHGILQARILAWGRLPLQRRERLPSSGDLSNPGIESRSPTLQTDSLPAEPQGKPKNTGMGSLSLLQQIFQTPALHVDSLPAELPGKPLRPQSVLFSHSVVSDSLRPHRLQHARPPCPSPPAPRAYSNSSPLSQ